MRFAGPVTPDREIYSVSSSTPPHCDAPTNTQGKSRLTKRLPDSSKHRAESASGQFDELGVIRRPEVLGAVGQQHDALRVEGLGRTGIVGDEHHRSAVAAQRVEHLLARRWI